MARNKYDVDEVLETPFNKEQFKRVFKFAVPYRKTLIATLIVIMSAAVLNLITPLILQHIIDDYIPQKNSGMVIFLGILNMVCIIVAAFLTSFRMRATNRVGQGIIHDMRLEMFKHLQQLPFTYFDDRPHGKIVVRIVNYVNSISDIISTGLINAVAEVFNIIVIIVLMLIMDPLLTLIAMCGLPILVFGIVIIKGFQRRAQQILSMRQSNLNAYTQESLVGMKVTQVFSREEENRGIFDRLSKDYRKAWMKSAMLNISLWPWVEAISNFTVAALYLIGTLVLRNMLGGYFASEAIGVGVIIAFVSYVKRFWTPVNNIMNYYGQLIQSAAYIERICEFLDEPTVIDDKPEAKDLENVRGNISFNNVTFGYEEGMDVLKNVCFDIEAGQTVALVGPTGAGKSTVVNLVSRFYDVTGGSITIDGTDIRDVTKQSLRKNQGIMLQEPFLFPDTVLENIRYGRLDATDEECIEAAKAVHADEFINRLPYGYNTYIRQNGGGVSAGERQLISFARVMLSKPAIVILDEATSSIDTQTEKAVQKGLEVMLKGRTAFVIAHRLSTVRNADKIMYIAEKGVSESGTHDELMEKEGLYYKLYQSQLAELV